MDELILLEECPICRGAGLILHEGGWCVQVECADCSAQTVNGQLMLERQAERAWAIWNE